MILLAQALYWIVLGGLAYMGAAAVARVLRGRGRQERGAWVFGMAAALLLPLVLPAVGRALASAPPASGTSEPVAVIALAPLFVGVPESAGAWWLGSLLVAAWGAMSAIMLARYVLSLRVVQKIRASAQPTSEGIRVSERHGPGVVGLLRPEVLMPAWVMELPQAQRDWILRHETEHVRGRDPLLLAVLHAARILLPWNPWVWAFGRSIRAAIETDCDRRTIGTSGDARSYGEALLTVASGARPADRLPALAPAFVEHHASLDHRIDAMARPRRRLSARTCVGMLGLTLVAGALACEVPAPTEAATGTETITVPPRAVDAGQDPEGPQGEGRYMQSGRPDDVPVPEYDGFAASPEEMRSKTAAERLDEPRFIAYDQAPRLQNAGDVRQAMSAEYPPVLREAGIGGTVNVWLYIDAEGQVSRTQVNEPSGLEALDAAALRLANEMRFAPAMNGTRRVAVWVSMPISFNPSTDGGNGP